jgi:hypothetical protein
MELKTEKGLKSYVSQDMDEENKNLLSTYFPGGNVGLLNLTAWRHFNGSSKPAG